MYFVENQCEGFNFLTKIKPISPTKFSFCTLDYNALLYIERNNTIPIEVSPNKSH